MSGPVMDYISLDLETTGLNPKTDKIIEIGAVHIHNGEVIDCFETFINPGCPLRAETKELTGITDAELEHAPEIEEVLDTFLDFCGELPLLGHRILFDYSFVKRAVINRRTPSIDGKRSSFERSGIDTLKLSRCFLSELESRRLKDLCMHYGIELNAHRALHDAKAAHYLYLKLCEVFYKSKPSSAQDCPDGRELFRPVSLEYRIKRENPITKVQTERLHRLLEERHMKIDKDITQMTRNEADRLIDLIRTNRNICID